MQINEFFEDPNPLTPITSIDVLRTAKFLALTSCSLWLLILCGVLTSYDHHGASNHIPLPLLANLADRNGTNTLTSARYGNLKSQIYQPVRTADFAGYWICRGFAPNPIEPRASDLVIYYLHGGGYVAGHPADNISDLLFVAESLAKKNITISIFSLDYTLAPRASFPKQIEETAAAYEYLVVNLGIDPSKVVIMGESAGAHLALSFLTNLYMQSTGHPAALRKTPSTLAKPAMAVLVSPWIDLYTSNPRAKELEKRDFLSKSTLDTYSEMLLRTTPPEIKAMYENFGRENGERASWKTILPDKTWVSAGGDELFVEDIKGFVRGVERDGCKVTFELTEGETHAWQTKIAAINRGKFLAASHEDVMDEGWMKGYDGIVKAILAMYERQ